MRSLATLMMIVCGCSSETPTSEPVDTNPVNTQKSDNKQTQNIRSASNAKATESTTVKPESKPLGPDSIKEGTSFDTQATRVISGDSVEVTTPNGETVVVHLYGVAAAKEGQELFLHAKNRLKHLIDGRPILIRVRKVLGEGSFAVDLYVPPEVFYSKPEYRSVMPPVRINNQLVNWGYAWHDDRQAPDDGALEDSQRNARLKRLGLWDSENPTPPWQSQPSTKPQ